MPGRLLWPFRASPTLSLCLYFVSLTFLAIAWKSTFSFPCYFSNASSQVSGPIFSWQTEHSDVQPDASGEGPEAHHGTGGCVLRGRFGDDLVGGKFTAGLGAGPQATSVSHTGAVFPSVCLPALHPHAHSCNPVLLPAITILTPFPFLYASEEPAGVVKPSSATDRTCFHLGDNKGVGWGSCWRGEGAGCQGTFDLPEVGLRFPTVVP